MYGSGRNYAESTLDHAMSESNVPKKTPVVTYTVIGLCVLVYIWELTNFPAVEATLVNPIATNGVSALWTLFTMTLVHSRTQVTHILFNLYAFFVLGKIVETLYGSIRLAVLLIVLAWVASAAQIEFERNIGIGLSGVVYGVFGFFANFALLIHVMFIFALMSAFGATLTLPGIAGIVLTVGIAVDSNVLIYERIREEVRGGRSAINAIDAGFSRALATILDSNITTFIAAAVLFYIGTGPVRGFAVTLGIGILTSLFTAFTLTRLIMAYWVRMWRPRTVPI